jgi:phosphoenolpyruvate---glycerone phosphotransferase subunit DhaL
MSLDANTLRLCLLAAATAIKSQEAALNQLDSAIGDGDHGITMRIGFDALSRKIASLPEDAGLSTVLQEAGKAFLGATGGAMGPLLGGMLIAGGKALSGQSAIDANSLGVLLNAMESSLSHMGKAKPGDKTILDALHSARLALENANPQNLSEAFSVAAEGAALGAQATSSMLCVKGRASRLGDRVLGHPDPGAVSFSVILTAISDQVRTQLVP